MYFFRKYKNGMMVALVTIILFVIIGTTGENREEISKTEKVLMNTVLPINDFTSKVREKIFDTFSSLRNISNMVEENKKLKNQIAKLEEDNRNLENIIGKSDYLQEEAEILKTTDLNLVSGTITSKEPGNWYNTFVIDKGTKDGIKKGDTVIQGIKIKHVGIKEGIVGRVYEVSDNSSKVISIIDESSNISFKTTRTQDGGVISGNIDSSLTGYLFDSDADVKVGDKLYTSGLGEVFKEDIYIGEIEKVIDAEDELMKRINIKPAINFKKLYKVLVVID